MPFALLFAFLISLAAHLWLLLGPGVDWLADSAEHAPPAPLIAELKPRPLPPKVVSPKPAVEEIVRAKEVKAKEVEAEKQTPPLAKPLAKAPKPPSSKDVERPPVLSVPETSLSQMPIEETPIASLADESEPNPRSPIVSDQEVQPAPSAPATRLASNGAIDYRVDRGDSNFAIGIARHQWEIDGDKYRLTSMVQSTGIVYLFKDFRVEMESRGTLTADGLRPDFFVLRRNDKPAWEKAFFDWQRMKVRVGDKEDQDLDPGAQDFLSFNYQLGFLSGAGAGSTLPIATGRKYSLYAFESLGDEEIEIPAGRLRTLHLRAPGDNTTELWLAYDYQLLPVKIRHVDSKGDSLVQVATHIQMSSP